MEYSCFRARNELIQSRAGDRVWGKETGATVDKSNMDLVKVSFWSGFCECV